MNPQSDTSSANINIHKNFTREFPKPGSIYLNPDVDTAGFDNAVVI